MTFYTLLCFLPILGLLGVSLWRGVRPAVYFSLALTTVIFFGSGSSLRVFAASLVNAMAGTLQILMIILGAMLLYDVMSQKGYLRRIEVSLEQIHPQRELRFWFLALFLTAFFESVAGFGTPGAIVPLLLIRLGFPAVLSISSVLLIDGLFAVSGAVGTPVTVGLKVPLGLSELQVREIYTWAGGAIGLAGIVIIFFVHRSLPREGGPSVRIKGWLMFAALMGPFALLAGFLRELTGIVSSLIMAAVSVIFIFTRRRIPLRPWAPYGVLVFFLLLPKLIPPLHMLLGPELAVENLFGTGIKAGLQPLRSPLFPFLVAALFALILAGDFRVSLGPVFRKTAGVFLILFPSLAITQLMLHGGTEQTPSIVEALAEVFQRSGAAYPVLSPFIGVLGAFMTGSTTVSNLIFGPVQYTAAQTLGYSSSLILGLQLAGGSLGNAVCLFNIIAAASVAEVRDYRGILRRNLLPVLLATLVISAVGMIGLWLTGR